MLAHSHGHYLFEFMNECDAGRLRWQRRMNQVKKQKIGKCHVQTIEVLGSTPRVSVLHDLRASHSKTSQLHMSEEENERRNRYTWKYTYEQRTYYIVVAVCEPHTNTIWMFDKHFKLADKQTSYRPIIVVFMVEIVATVRARAQAHTHRHCRRWHWKCFFFIFRRRHRIVFRCFAHRPCYSTLELHKFSLCRHFTKQTVVLCTAHQCVLHTIRFWSSFTILHEIKKRAKPPKIRRT